MENNLYITIDNIEIPYVIKSYKKSKHIKIFFKDGIVKVTKPTWINKEVAIKFLMENRDSVYVGYLKSLQNKKQKTKLWVDNEKIMYRGEIYTVQRKVASCKKIKLDVNEHEEKFIITVPENVEECEIKEKVDKLVKKHLKAQTEGIIEEALEYWSNVMKIPYNTFVVKDTISRYGSCVPKTKALQFSSRLAMLPQREIDAIVVHELSHIIHKNHNKDFYNLVGEYIPDYKEIDKWLKSNSNQMYI